MHHSLITFFWLLRGSHQPSLTARFLGIIPTLYDLFTFFWFSFCFVFVFFKCFEAEQACTLTCGFCDARKTCSNQYCMDLIPGFKTKNSLSCGSLSENQTMESLSFVPIELNRINKKHYSLQPCPPTHDYTDLLITESGGGEISKYLFLPLNQMQNWIHRYIKMASHNQYKFFKNEKHFGFCTLKWKK